jgi:hypothetical protein
MAYPNLLGTKGYVVVVVVRSITWSLKISVASNYPQQMEHQNFVS